MTVVQYGARSGGSSAAPVWNFAFQSASAADTSLWARTAHYLLSGSGFRVRKTDKLYYLMRQLLPLLISCGKQLSTPWCPSVRLSIHLSVCSICENSYWYGFRQMKVKVSGIISCGNLPANLPTYLPTNLPTNLPTSLERPQLPRYAGLVVDTVHWDESKADL